MANRTNKPLRTDTIQVVDNGTGYRISGPAGTRLSLSYSVTQQGFTPPYTRIPGGWGGDVGSHTFGTDNASISIVLGETDQNYFAPEPGLIAPGLSVAFWSHSGGASGGGDVFLGSLFCIPFQYLLTTPNSPGSFQIQAVPYVGYRFVNWDGVPASNAPVVQYQAIFSEPVGPVSVEDFALATTGTITTVPSIAAITGAGDAWTISVNVGAMEGEIGVNLADTDQSIRDGANLPLANGGGSAPHAVDTIAPTASFSLADYNPTTADTVTFGVEFSEPLTTSPAPANVLIHGLVGTAAVAGSGQDYVVTVALADPTANGTVAIGFSGLADLAGNPYTGNTSPMYTIYHWPGLTTQPSDAMAYLGGSHTFRVASNFGPITPAFLWKHFVSNGGKTSGALLNGPASQEWALTHSTSADAGDYWCEITYDGQMYASNTATLAVAGHLAITGPPTDTTGKIGETCTFSVNTSGGFPPLSYTWKKNGAIIPDATSSSFTTAPLGAHDGGVYIVEVTDSLADVATAGANLTVVYHVPVWKLAGALCASILVALAGVLMLFETRRTRRRGDF